jgi:hypothetical protein
MITTEELAWFLAGWGAITVCILGVLAIQFKGLCDRIKRLEEINDRKIDK